MDYQRHYTSLIVTRKNRPIPQDQYYENITVYLDHVGRYLWKNNNNNI